MAERGYLTVSVTGGGVAVPVPDAMVKVFKRTYSKDGIYDMDYAKKQVIDGAYENMQSTDSTGKTQIIPIETPEIYESFEKSGSVPYSLVDIYIEKKGYFGVLLFGVQIFPQRESIVPVNLEPFSDEISSGSFVTDQYTGNYAFVYFIPAPEAQNSSERPEISRNENSTDDPRATPFVAENVYVPQTITVHLGRPDSNAENVTVSFQDYIKNVASSEIYPTWPESALRANIVAQISIALNRIYTEWYPGQGYPFQITNSTAFDQAFVYGRNIYSNIEQIVDEIFNTYIRQQGFVEPLFATYCDGRTTSCNGLSQWGSFALANDGYTTLEILRYYYGDNIELAATTDIRGVESTYGGTPLAVGSMGEDVATIQRQLNRIRSDYPAIPFVVFTNGVFGTDTDSAVRAFQRIFNLTPDGIVGKATWYKISYVYVSVKRLAELTSEGQNPEFKIPEEPVVLSRGDRGDAVAVLQYLLEYISIFYKNVLPTDIDGVFGVLTESSLISYQESFGLEPTGTTTQDTWNSLYQTYLDITRTVLPLQQNQNFPGTLQQGNSGDSVLQLQRYLNAVSSYYGDLPSVEADGIFGSATRNAVQDFQRMYLSRVTGTVDPETWYRLVELYNYVSSQTSG